MKFECEQLGRAIRNLRKLRGMTQGKLAEKAEVTTAFVSLLENGKKGISINNLDKIAEALNVSPATLTFLGSIPPKDRPRSVKKVIGQIQELIIDLARAAETE